VNVRFRRGVMASAAAVAGAATIAVAATPARAAAPRARVGTAATLPAGARVTGKASRATRLHLDVALASRDPLALKRYATAVSTPGNSNYSDYLSVGQFAHRFGARTAHITALRRVLRHEGLKVSAATANGLSLHVSGRAGAVERAFQVQLRSVRTASGRVATTNVTAPTLPAGVAPWVQSVVGLDTTRTLQPAGVQQARLRAPASHHRTKVRTDIATGGPQPCTDASDDTGSGGGLTADAIATAYGFPTFYGTGNFGQGEHIALIELGQAFNPSDITEYASCYGVSTPVNAINVDGGPPAGSQDDESELDIEIAMGMAPESTIDVYQTATASAQEEVDALTQVVTANVDKTISLSYGGCEFAGDPTLSAEETLLEEAAIQGQSFFASTGDQGSVCSGDTTTPSVNDPASDPFATAVGGTALYGGGDDAQGNTAAYTPGGPAVESVWNDGTATGAPSGGGGGISSVFTMPAYQSSANPALGVTTGGSAAPCASTVLCREIPDVSADADPTTGYAVYEADGGGWIVVGGTSAAAPLWASYIALTDDSAGCAGKPLGLINPSLYQIAGAAYSTNFADVTLPSPFTDDGQAYPGSNDALGTNNGAYPVTTGYDMATGLGTMTASTGASLCADRPVVSLATPAAQSTLVGTPVSLQVTGSDSTAEPLTWISSGLPAGLTVNAATGAITGTPTTPGVSTVTIEAYDTTGVAAAVVFSWTITTPPPPPPVKKGPATNKPINVKFTGLGKRKPALSFGWDVAKNSKALTGIAITLPKGLSFAKAKSVTQGLVVKSGGKKATIKKLTVKKGELVITLKKKATKLTVSLTRPALKITGAEATKVKKGKVKSLKLKVTGIADQKQITRTVTVGKVS
jgi:hypothetical protein